MKKIAILLLFGGTLFAAPALAQTAAPAAPEHANPRPTRGSKEKELKEKFGLNDLQVKQLKELHRQTRDQREDLQDDTSLTPDQRKGKMKDLRQASYEKLVKIVGQETADKIEAMRKERGEGAHQGKRGKKGDMPPPPPKEGKD